MKRVFLFLTLLLGHFEVLASQDHGQTRTESPHISAFVQRIEILRQKASIPGLSLAVLHNHEIIFAAGFGYSNLEDRVPATADTPYDIASVAKPLSAVVALRLVEEGVLDLDRPIAEFSDWNSFCERFSTQPSIFARKLHCQPSEHTLRHLFSHTATEVPGSYFSYNPILYSWASRPIMSATDVPFSKLVERYVFAPAGMEDSARKHRALPLRDDLAERLAVPYHIDDSGKIKPTPKGRPQGDGAAGGVVSTVLDLARFDIALDEGRLISTKSRAEMMTPTRIINGKAAPYGLGWYVQDYGGHTLVWHSGWWENAYSALYLKIPELKMAFIVLANSEGVWWGNPLDEAAVDRSSFAQAFLSAFVSR